MAVLPASQFRWKKVPSGDDVAAVLLYNADSRRLWLWVGGFAVPTDGGDFSYGSGGQQVVVFQAA